MAKTGSDGNGYSLADFLGHTIKKVSPSLVQVRGKDSFYKEWTGVRSEAILSLYQNDQKVKEERGEVQFTDYGISGICTFNLSGDIAQNKEMKSIIYINFVPWFQGSKDEFLKWLNNQIELLKDFSLKGVLEGFLNVKLVNLFLKLLKIENKTWQDIDKMALIELLFNFKFEVLTTNDFTDSQVTRGGIPLNEVFETLESKKTKSLYFTGEILDVDGDCGGYNLGFAWMSGLIVGDNL